MPRRNKNKSSYPKMESKDEKVLKKGHECEYEVRSLKRTRDNLIECDVGGTSPTGKPLTGLGCNKIEEVDECFKRAKNKEPAVFNPISSYRHGEKYLVLGEFVGHKFEEWVIHNQANLYTHSDQLSDLAKDIGKQVCEVITKHHQNGKFIGNIKEGLYINDKSKLVFIPCTHSVDEISGFTTGVKKDLADLRWVMTTLKSKLAKNNTPACTATEEAFNLFFELFPTRLQTEENEKHLMTVSYILCHNPLFWGLDERYTFSGIAKKVYEDKKSDIEGFKTNVPLDSGSTNVGKWWTKLTTLPPNDVLRMVYNVGVSNGHLSNVEHYIIPFIRNTSEHYQQHDITKTHEDVDMSMINLFPNAHFKIYLAMASPNKDNFINLDFYLQDKGLNYSK